jgi:hypothetical protein
MSPGSRNVPVKLVSELPEKFGGMSPVAKILLPQFAAAAAIRLTSPASGRRIAESRRRRIRPI